MRSFALFGSRTALPDPWDALGFWPTDRLLQEGDAIIPDGSPIFDGFVVDTSNATSFGPNAAQAAMAADDLAYRHSILDAVRAGATFAEIAVAVDEHLTAAFVSGRSTSLPTVSGPSSRTSPARRVPCARSHQIGSVYWFPLVETFSVQRPPSQ